MKNFGKIVDPKDMVTKEYVDNKDAETYALGNNRTDILINADLNDIKTVGNYRCTNTDRARTLKNCPTDVWFTMRVGLADGASSTWLYQEIIDANNNWWRRIHYGSYWADWTSTKAKEAFLEWGGKNHTASYGPIDAAMINVLGANRLELAKPAGIAVEYSTDAGETWIDYEASDNDKQKLMSTIGATFVTGKAALGNMSLNNRLRVTLTFPAVGTYTTLNKFAIYVSTYGAGDCWCTIDGARKSDETTFITYADKVSIAGWSGWNIINYPNGITTYSNSDYQTSILRFTFGYDKISYPQYAGLCVYNILGFGGVGWATPNNLARYGHLYTYDVGQNAIFPAHITATQFNGPLNGNASTATLARDVGETSITIHPQSSNEINFGGSFTGNTDLFIGYRAIGNRQIPAKFVFGGASGTATIQAANFTGNAASASILKHSTALNADTVDSFHPSDLAYANVSRLSGIGLGGNDGILIWVPYSTSYGRQIIFDDTDHTILSRAYNNGTWSAWKDLSDANKVNGHTVNSNVPSNAKFTDTTISMSMDTTDTKKLIISLT